MILTTAGAESALSAWRANGTPIDDDTAQTIASWWHSPGNPDLSRFSHGMSVGMTWLRYAVETERAQVMDLPEREELDALIGWIDRRGDSPWPGVRG